MISGRGIRKLMVRVGMVLVAVVLAFGSLLGLVVIKERGNVAEAMAWRITTIATDSGAFNLEGREIVRTSLGDIYVFYTLDADSTGWYASSGDGGVTWDSPVSFTSGDSLLGVTFVFVDIDVFDTIHILYSGFDLSSNPFVHYRQLSGGVLGAISTVASATSPSEVRAEDMYVDTDGDAHVVYGSLPSGGNERVYYRERTGGSWAAAELVFGGTDSGYRGHIAPYSADGNDSLVGISELIGSTCYIYAYKRISGSWSSKMVACGGGGADCLWVGRDKNIYYELGDGVTYRAYESGTSWVPVTVYDASPVYSLARAVGPSEVSALFVIRDFPEEPDMLMEIPGEGNGDIVGGCSCLGVCEQGVDLPPALYMVYNYYSGSDYRLQFRVEAHEGAGFGSGTTYMSTVASSLLGPWQVASRDIVVDSNGRIYAFYCDTTELTHAEFKYSDDHGVTWSDAIYWDAEAGINGGSIESVDIDSSDVIHISWIDSSEGGVWYSEITNGVVTTAEYVRGVSPFGDEFGYAPGYIDSSGVFHLLLGFTTGGISDLYYMERSAAGVWSSMIDLSASGAYLSIGPWNASGDVIVAWEMAPDEVYAMRRIGGVWGSTELLSDTAGGNATYVSRGTSSAYADVYGGFTGQIEKITWDGEGWGVTVLETGSLLREVIQTRAASRAVPAWLDLDAGKLAEYITYTMYPRDADLGGGLGGCDQALNIPAGALTVYNYWNGVTYDLMFFSQEPPPYPGNQPLVLTISATSITESSAVLNGWLSYCRNPCNYSFQWSQVSGGPYSSLPWSSGTVNSGESFSMTVTGLSPGTTFYFRAMCKNAVNAASWGYGLETYFTTVMTLPVITTQAADDISVSTAKLKAYLLSSGGGTCDVRVQWGTPMDWYAVGDDSALDAYGANDFAGQTFIPGEDYSLEGVALKLYRDVAGVPGVLTVEIYDTLAGTPIGSALGTGTYDGNILGVTGTWVAIDLVGPVELSGGNMYAIVLEALTAGGVGDAVHWSCNSGGGYGDGTGLTSTNGGATWSTETDDCMFTVFSEWTTGGWNGPYSQGDNIGITVESFTAGMVYRFRAEAQNTLGIGIGATLCFITESTPYKPTGLKATAISYSEVFLTWTKGRGAYKTRVIWKINGYPQAYNDIGDGVNGGVGYFDTGTSCTIGGLSAGVTYYFAVWSFIADGGGGTYVTREPDSIYTMDGGSNYNTVVDTDFLGTSNGYYTGDKIYNDTRVAEAEISGYTYTGGTGTAALSAGGIAGQTVGDDFHVVYWTKAMITTPAGYSSTYQPYSLSGTGNHTNWFLQPNDNAVPFLPGRGMLEDAATQFGMRMGYMLFLCSMIAACMIGFASFLVSRSLTVTICSIGAFLLICMLLQTAPGWCFFLYVAVGAPTGYILNKGPAV